MSQDPTPFKTLLGELKSPCFHYAFSIGIPNYFKKKLNINRITFGTSEDFDHYDDWLKSTHPKMYWFENVLMDKVQDAFCWLPSLYNGLRSKIQNRFIDRVSVLQTGLDPWTYNEIETRMIHGLFNTFKIYIEVELAHYSQVFYSEETEKERKDWTPIQHAMSHLEWEIDYTEGNQSVSAKEKMELYKWWTEIRPNRIDPWVLVVEEECDNSPVIPSLSKLSYEEKYGDYNRELVRQEEEDTEMLVRLIKLRSSLWT
jgi:hypothetical protein